MSLAGKIDDLAVRMAADNIADWFGAITADQLAEYAAAQTGVAAMLPMVLQIPDIVYRMSRLTLLPYLRGILRGHRKAEMYERILLYLADPRHYGNRFFEHCLVLAHGRYPPGSPMADGILRRFPALATVSSVQPWYVANMDRVVIRLIQQLEGGESHGHDKRPAHGVGDNGDRADSRGFGGGGLLPGQEGVLDHDLAPAFPDDEPGGGFNAYSA